MQKIIFQLALACALAAPSMGQPVESNNLWVLWERVDSRTGTPESTFRSHLMLNVPPNEAVGFFNSIAPSAQTYGAANVQHEKSPLCLKDPPEQPTSIATDDLELAKPANTLRGLNGVYVDFRAVLGPRTFVGDFGAAVHGIVTKALKANGIPILTKEQMELAPGNPYLTFSFSPQVQGCKPWSVSLALKQKVVLTRDTTIMLEASSWSSRAGQNQSDIEYDEMNALNDAVLKFVTDYVAENPPEGSQPKDKTVAKK